MSNNIKQLYRLTCKHGGIQIHRWHKNAANILQGLFYTGMAQVLEPQINILRNHRGSLQGSGRKTDNHELNVLPCEFLEKLNLFFAED